MPKDVFEKKIPILGICYGLQLIAKLLEVKLNQHTKEENLEEQFYLKKNSPLIKNI